MAEGTVYQVRIEGLASGGAGLARVEGKSVFIAGSVPGETVRCRVVEDRRSWASAELLDIVEASACRVEPRCPRYGICGGCNLQHIGYEAALAAKSAILRDAFIRIGGFSPPDPVLVPSAPWEYRNRMRFHRKAAGGDFGLKARKSGVIIPVPDCPIADPGIRQALSLDGPALPWPPGRDRCTVYARNGLLLSEGGTERGWTRLLDRDITLDAGVFFQSNGAMLERLMGDLREIAARGDRSAFMADLYSGVGTFAAFVGDLFSGADLVEENQTALALARENTRHINAEFFALRDDEWVKLNGARGQRDYGFIIADPPRQGLSPSLAYWIAAKGPSLFTYVSCDAATLARDSKILKGGGYDLTELRFYDFYPQTAHIESLAVFRK
jgi:23S rRNA (uracil1939-C5)-methyltransferase